jgi:ribosomal protein S6
MKEYELTYLVSSSFTKEEADNYHEKLKKDWSKKANLTGKEQLPVRRVLAYEVNKEKEGYLACFSFNAEEDAVLDLQEELKKKKEIMRYIVVKKRTRVIKEKRKKKEDEKEVKDVKKTKKKTSAPKKTELNDIDEKIEEIA